MIGLYIITLLYTLYMHIHYSLFVDIFIVYIFPISRAFYILHNVGIICIKASSTMDTRKTQAATQIIT